jgi:hypothetical protein
MPLGLGNEYGQAKREFRDLGEVGAMRVFGPSEWRWTESESGI